MAHKLLIARVIGNNISLGNKPNCAFNTLVCGQDDSTNGTKLISPRMCQTSFNVQGQHKLYTHAQVVISTHRPLVPQKIAKSDDKGIPHRTFLVMHSKPPKIKRSYCCRFMCWTIKMYSVIM